MSRRSLALLVAALVAVGAAGESYAKSKADTNVLPPPDGAVSIRPGDANYRIGPQDMLDINVFQVPDLSKSMQVDSGGKIRMPLIGEEMAAGKTTDELASQLEADLGQKYLKNPQVTVAIKEAASQKITVDGAVREPGIYALQGPTTLMQAVALAKGADSKLANLHKVAVVREVGNEKRAAMFDLAAIREGKAPDPQIYGKDVIIVDTSGTKSFLQNGSPLFPLLGILPFL
jgi:polysaccharide export outer membrane protein